MINDRALKIKEVASVLSVHYQTVWTLIRDGKIKAVNVSPRRKVVFESEVNRYLSAISGEGHEAK